MKEINPTHPSLKAHHQVSDVSQKCAGKEKLDIMNDYFFLLITASQELFDREVQEILFDSLSPPRPHL